MKVFLNNSATLNYPLADGQDISGIQSLLMDLSVTSSSNVYLRDIWSTGTQIGGLFTNGALGETPFGHFFGSIDEQTLYIYTDQDEYVGWVALGPGVAFSQKHSGKWLVNPVCIVRPVHVLEFSVGGVQRQYPEVLKIVPTDYIQVDESGTGIERTDFANTQLLDARDWDKNGPILSINGITTVSGNVDVPLHVGVVPISGSDTILLTDTDTFICKDTYAVRDRAIMDHKDYGLTMELPLDNMVRVWAGNCQRRPPDWVIVV